VLAGPVESIDRASGSFSSLGQLVYANEAAMNSLSVGDYVGVSGDIVDAGQMSASAVYRFSDAYVAGSSRVFLTGIPSSVDRSRGEVGIGGATVDYTPALGRQSLDRIGAALTVFGTQPNPGGRVVSDSLADASAMFMDR